jgi:hypothetical protein
MLRGAGWDYWHLCQALFFETFAGPSTHDKKLVYASDSAEPGLELNGFYLLSEELKTSCWGFNRQKSPFTDKRQRNTIKSD